MTDLTLSNISNISTIENTNRAINVLVDDQVIETEEAWRICGELNRIYGHKFRFVAEDTSCGHTRSSQILVRGLHGGFIGEVLFLDDGPGVYHVIACVDTNGRRTYRYGRGVDMNGDHIEWWTSASAVRTANNS